MPIGELWPWGRWHGHPQPVPDPWAPYPHLFPGWATTPMTRHVPPGHRCAVRSSRLHGSTRWGVACASCSHVAGNGNVTREAALADAIKHYAYNRGRRAVNA